MGPRIRGPGVVTFMRRRSEMPIADHLEAYRKQAVARATVHSSAYGFARIDIGGWGARNEAHDDDSVSIV
jgi:hypothetical protein